MAHLLLHKCYIHIEFSVTETEKKFTSCCWFLLILMFDNTLDLDRGTNLLIHQQCRLEPEMRAHPIEHQARTTPHTHYTSSYNPTLCS